MIILIVIKSDLKLFSIHIRFIILSDTSIITIMIADKTNDTLRGENKNTEDKNNNFIISRRKFS